MLTRREPRQVEGRVLGLHAVHEGILTLLDPASHALYREVTIVHDEGKLDVLRMRTCSSIAADLWFGGGARPETGSAGMLSSPASV